MNARYQQLADHYQCAIVPARVKRPRDKAAAENAVNVVNKRVIGYLEDDVFTTLAELNAAIEERVREINTTSAARTIRPGGRGSKPKSGSSSSRCRTLGSRTSRGRN
ncbi:hypothetical protein IWX78_003109 [Mycetocola sp. CAN_C7]